MLIFFSLLFHNTIVLLYILCYIITKTSNSFSLLDNATNYLVGCAIQKRFDYFIAVSEDEDPMVTGRPANRIKNSLYALGIPIVQGASSTIIGVSGLYFAHCYLYVTFFKMIFLVIVLGMFHGMILLPILLSLMGPGKNCLLVH